jgi:hypothetical protein
MVNKNGYGKIKINIIPQHHLDMIKIISDKMDTASTGEACCRAAL